MSTLPSPLSRFRQPEYTGENRCIPCTAVNEVIAAVLAVAVGAVAWSAAGATAGVAAGLVVFAGASALVYLRGYLVPGTPTLTKRYLPDSVLARFDKAPPAVESYDDLREYAPESDLEGIDDGFEIVDPEQVLFEAEAIEACESHDLCLTDDFADDVFAAAETHDDRDAQAAVLADLFAVDEVRFETESGRPVAYGPDGRLNGWPSDAALLADVAAQVALSGRDGWPEVAAEQRIGILEALRGFLSTCPVCGGRVGPTDERVESCCRAWDIIAIRCYDCEAHFIELTDDQFEEQVPEEVTGPTGGGFAR